MLKERISIGRKPRNRIKALAMKEVAKAATRIADACNAESSWGFYTTEVQDDAAYVVALDTRSEQRGQRLLRNAEKGKP